jgi:hypothetical protein
MKTRIMVYKIKQYGVIMPIAMIFLFFLSMIGITLLQASVLEQLMAGNTQQLHRAFHAAESGLAKALTYARDNRSALGSGTDLHFATQIDNVRVEYTIQKIAESKTLPRGYSLRGEFTAQHYAIEAYASIQSGAWSTHVRGFTVVGPGT